MPIRIARSRSRQTFVVAVGKKHAPRCRRIVSAVRAAGARSHSPMPGRESPKENRSCCDGDHILIAVMSLS
jgi:hypothetical protein